MLVSPNEVSTAAGATEPLYRGDEIIAEAHVGPKKLRTGGAPFEVFVWQKTGRSAAVVDSDSVLFEEGDCAVLGKGSVYDWEVAPGGVLLSVANARPPRRSNRAEGGGRGDAASVESRAGRGDAAAFRSSGRGDALTSCLAWPRRRRGVRLPWRGPRSTSDAPAPRSIPAAPRGGAATRSRRRYRDKKRRLVRAPGGRDNAATEWSTPAGVHLKREAVGSDRGID